MIAQDPGIPKATDAEINELRILHSRTNDGRMCYQLEAWPCPVAKLLARYDHDTENAFRLGVKEGIRRCDRDSIDI